MLLNFRCFKNKKTGQVCHVPVGRYGNFLNIVKKLASYVQYIRCELTPLRLLYVPLWPPLFL